MTLINKLRQEQQELSERLLKLKVFIKTDAYYDLPCKDKYLLRKQLNLMIRYDDVLWQRLARVTKMSE